MKINITLFHHFHHFQVRLPIGNKLLALLFTNAKSTFVKVSLISCEMLKISNFEDKKNKCQRFKNSFLRHRTTDQQISSAQGYKNS